MPSKWYVPVKDEYKFLTVTGAIERGTFLGAGDHLYFESEAAAHHHANAYYMRSGKDYPYIMEWADACSRMPNGSSAARITDDVKSEVMTF